MQEKLSRDFLISFLLIMCWLIHVSARTNAESSPRRVPTNSLAAPTSQPIAADGYHFTPVVKIFFANVDTNAINWVGQVGRCLIRGGDIVSAEHLLPYCNYSEDLELAGLVAAYSPEPNLENAKRIRGSAKNYSTEDLARGLVSGLAMQGKYREALAIAKSQKSSESRLRGIILNHKPNVERVEAFAKDFPPDKLYGGVSEYIRALILVGQDEEARRMFDILSQRGPSDLAPIRLTMINAYLQANKPDVAKELAIGLKAMDKQMVDVLFAREAARKGDDATLVQLLNRPGNILARSKIMALRVYTCATAGDIEAAKKLCEEPTRETILLGSRYGMLAAVLHQKGKKDEATKIVEEAARKIDQLPNAEAKCTASAHLIYAAILGIDTFSFGAAYEDLW